MMRLILLILISFGLISCKIFGIPSKGTFAPLSNFKVPPGTPAFKSGYKDGCSSVLYSRGNMFYRSRYEYRYDPNMIDNTEYKFGYSKGNSWCFTHIVGISPDNTLGPGDGLSSLSPYGARPMFDTSPNNIDNAFDGMFGGLSAPINANTDSTPGGLSGIFDVYQKGISGGQAGAGGSVFGSNPLWSGDKGVGFMGIW